MSKAFLSHSSLQKPLVEIIAQKLGRDNCVLDKYNFEIGTPTLDSIMHGIAKTDLFVLFISDEALDSAWVQREISIINNLRNADFKKKILIFVIDKTINHQDERIPLWLREEYNLQPVLDPILLFKKIDSKLRDISIASHPYILKRESIFVGRNKLMEEFEEKYYNLENVKPSAIIVSGFEEVGRRKFILHALGKVEKLNEFHQPITISLDSKESLEDFILRIEDLNSENPETTLRKISGLSMEEKELLAKDLLINFQKNNEILFILDNGCIVRPHKYVSSWFDKIIHSDEFFNSTCVCLISKFRPRQSTSKNSNRYISFHVPELQPLDRQILFLKYCELFELNPQKDQTEKILGSLNGMPNQIFHCAQMIKSEGIIKTINKLDDIKKFSDIKVVQIIEAIKTEGEIFYNLLVFIAKFEFVSYDFIYKLFGRSSKIEYALDQLYIYGVYDRIGINKEYINSHHAITDYVKRAKFPISQTIKEKLQKEMKLVTAPEDNEYNDLSQLLITIKSILETTNNIPDRYIIPSFIIRIIQNHYYEGNYDQVQALAEKILNNHLKYDTDIVREVRYILIMSYCRKGMEEFWDQIDYFEGLDHFFLRGFFLRHKKDFAEAERFIRKGLEIEPHSQKARRELVSALLAQSKYPDALEYAEANYNQNNLNAFHIQGYFKCLVRKPYLTNEDKETLTKLMEQIKISHDNKANEILLTMKGEYQYFVKKDMSGAIKMLKDAIDSSFYKTYPRKALAEIYNKNDFHSEFSKLKKQIENSEESVD